MKQHLILFALYVRPISLHQMMTLFYVINATWVCTLALSCMNTDLISYSKSAFETPEQHMKSVQN